MLGTSDVEKCWRQVLEKSVEKESCREVLQKRFCREVLEKSVVEVL